MNEMLSTKRAIAVLVFLAFLLLMACSIPSSENARGVAAGGDFHLRQVDPATIALTGVIAKGHFEEFAKFLGSGVRKLVVNSGGGDVEESLKIAELIHARGLGIVVDGVCASSCANYLFVAAKDKVVLPNSLLSFHGSSSFGIDYLSLEARRHVYWYFATHTEELSKNKQLTEFADKELAFYRKIGVSPDLIHIPTSIAASTGVWIKTERRRRPTPPQPVGEVKGWSDTISTTIVDAKISWWSPPPDELVRLGVLNIREFWYPESEAALKQLAPRLLGRGQATTGKPLAELTFPIEK